ncbi:adenylylsulfate kinase [Trinickia symbiotica]|uniref:Adenylyl-sulfate kinase n=1 Tax=Trinickia symbiotica TaxID=863227 RepID=A0A2N7WP41_9BURK|nr:adenylyl-sulfate kinase [Trinickia symbiotica]PMS31169.1 adenylyl-sulfate kinase [Trinickia symbiotica]PPK41324.1 adenylylsulfate kinase [Trinickia symbiotica]PTB17280.1 adenylyl-sulfate kinase [Trinickia symbiotica]
MTIEASAPHLCTHGFQVAPESRAQLLRQTPAILWFTGLSGAGKSTIANRVEARLHASGHLTYVLDGDSVRLGLCKDLGFCNDDRRENIRRVAEVAKLMADAGIVVLVCLISPFRSDREIAKCTAGQHKFVEIHVHAPLAVAEARDTKGLYRLARRGVIQNFTGIDSPYEPPTAPDIFIDTSSTSINEAANTVLAWVKSH